SDQMAIGCYEAVKGRGLHVPQDVSVAGFDDAPASRLLSPQLSTVRVPHAEMGEMAVDYLLAQAEGEAPRAFSQRIACSYVARASVADVAASA
ncbi:MAG TPA: substrate-binding domain-containing protein, partial [Devosia sp.]|nr:substrate-binding domain-containing protein [Devosia sp.]